MPSFPSYAWILAALVVASSLAPPDALAEVRHCVTAEGQSVFTDRECKQFGATEQTAPPRVVESSRTIHAGCARTIQDLVFEVTLAIDTRDTNRLASVYHWAGMSSGEAHRVWDRLDVLASRPLADIAPLTRSPAVAPTAQAAPWQFADEPLALEDATAEPPGPETQPVDALGAPPHDDAPVAVRIEQTAGNTTTPVRTILGLRRHFDCWWVSF